MSLSVDLNLPILDSTKISTEDAELLLSKTLLAMKFFHVLWPTALTQIGYDVWKIFPKNSEEDKLYNHSSQHSMLQILLNTLSGHFKWQLQVCLHDRRRIRGAAGWAKTIGGNSFSGTKFDVAASSTVSGLCVSKSAPANGQREFDRN